jgi:hypothetical protein
MTAQRGYESENETRDSTTTSTSNILANGLNKGIMTPVKNR